MGNLALFLQKAFRENCPDGWDFFSEKALLDAHEEALLGYSPRADALFVKRDGSLRLWIEFEVSRADPVANHAKFATTHIFFPRLETDIFLSMVSSHIARGRSNLAANTIWLMRRIGMQAYQTSLLPHKNPETIYRLNHLPLSDLDAESLPIKSEIERAMTVIQPMSNVAQKKIYYVANLMEVMLNVAQWNRDIIDPVMQASWGRRRITYFVYNPYTEEFAPSKFCAYIAIEKFTSHSKIIEAPMTIPLYAQIPWKEPIFDGNAARKHLENHLAMNILNHSEKPDLIYKFGMWCEQNKDFIIAPNEFSILIPPSWY
jgi:hypothetical protein